MTVKGARCLVKLAPTAPRASGLIEAPAMTPVPCIGKVVQVGPLCRDVQAGDLVLIPPSAGDPLSGMFPTPHLMVNEADILGVCERD
jgi:hypothetical protein